VLDDLNYDVEIDTPATLAVIGGGACGVEAALYGRFLGYSVELFDAHKIGDSLLCWGDRPMPGRWADLASSLGLAALEAHDHPLPEPESTPTYREYVEQYLLPTARNDLLYSSVSINTPLKAISRLGCSHIDHLSLERRAEQEFRLLLTSSQRGEFSQIVDIVLDCTGRSSVQQGMASGGGLPIGWNEVKSRVWRGRIRVLERKRGEFSGKRVLLWGNNAAAIANALELIQLTRTSQTQLFWIVPKRLDTEPSIIDPHRDYAPLSPAELLQAEQFYQEADALTLMTIPSWGVEAIRELNGEFIATLQTTENDTLDVTVDQLIDCSDYLSQPSYQHNLQIDQLPADQPWDCQDAAWYRNVLTQEPHLYVLGERAWQASESNSNAATPHAFHRIRHQIRAAFALIGGRADLDLYTTVKPQES
jgi:hypothetical protein